MKIKPLCCDIVIFLDFGLEILAQQAIEQKDANLNVTSIYILLVEPNGSYAPSGAICCSSSTMNHSYAYCFSIHNAYLITLQALYRLSSSY